MEFKYSIQICEGPFVSGKRSGDTSILIKSGGPIEVQKDFLDLHMKSVEKYLGKHKTTAKMSKKEVHADDVTMPFYFSPSLGFDANHLINSLYVANHAWFKENLKREFSNRSFASSALIKKKGMHLTIVSIGAVFVWRKRDTGWKLINRPQTYSCRSGDLPENPDQTQASDLPSQAIGINDSPVMNVNEFQFRSGDKVFIHTDGVSGRVMSQILHTIESSALPQEGEVFNYVSEEMRNTCVNQALGELFGSGEFQSEIEKKSMGLIYFEF